jgi:Fur family ferric uptake transcriptional regulator
LTRNDWPEGIKWTKQREIVLTVLENLCDPQRAAEIYLTTERSGQTVCLSTVYRILELYVQRGLVNKLNIMNQDTAVYEFNRLKHKHYAVCMRCRKIITLESCPMNEFFQELGDNDFQILGHTLEVYGYCKDCRM